MRWPVWPSSPYAVPWSEQTTARHGRRLETAAKSLPMWRSTYSRAAAWVARESPASRVAPGRWNQLGWCSADTFTNRKSRCCGGRAATTSSARATWASKEVGEGTPNSGSQWLSWKSPGSTEPSGACLLKKPTPPMHTVR